MLLILLNMNPFPKASLNRLKFIFILSKVLGLAPFSYSKNPLRVHLTQKSTIYTLFVSILIIIFFAIETCIYIPISSEIFSGESVGTFINFTQSFCETINFIVMYVEQFRNRKMLVIIINETISIWRALNRFQSNGDFPNKIFSSNFRKRIQIVIFQFFAAAASITMGFLFLQIYGERNNFMLLLYWLINSFGTFVTISLYFNFQSYFEWAYCRTLNFHLTQINNKISEQSKNCQQNSHIAKNCKISDDLDKMCILYGKIIRLSHRSTKLFQLQILILTSFALLEIVTSVSIHLFQLILNLPNLLFLLSSHINKYLKN